MKLIAAILFQAFFTLQIIAQTDENKKYFIRGSVFDEKGKPIAYSNIILYNSIDSAQQFATASDDKGRFVFNVTPGSYYCKISLLSFEERIITVINVADKDVELDSVFLKAAIKVLSEVVVTSEKKINGAAAR